MPAITGQPMIRQRGVALAISMVLLVAMSILGVATLSGTRLNEKISSNAQQKAIAFEAAESAINSTWSVDELLAILEQIPADEINDPGPIAPVGLAPALSGELDQTTGHGTSVDIEVEVMVQYCGESNRVSGSGMNADMSTTHNTGYLFDVNGIADIKNSNASADHLQRGVLSGPSTGRTGNCTVRG